MQKTIVWSTVYSKDVKFKTPCRPLFILATILSANKGLKVCLMSLTSLVHGIKLVYRNQDQT